MLVFLVLVPAVTYLILRRPNPVTGASVLLLSVSGLLAHFIIRHSLRYLTLTVLLVIPAIVVWFNSSYCEPAMIALCSLLAIGLFDQPRPTRETTGP